MGAPISEVMSSSHLRSTLAIDLREPPNGVDACGGLHPRPRTGVESGARGADGLVDVGGPGGGHRRDGGFGVRRHDVDALTCRGGHPGTTDEQLVLVQQRIPST